MFRLIFDIETGPQPEEKILERFDPSKVALGVLKDEKKIAAKKAAAKQKRLDNAALHADDGRVVAIGYMEDTNEPEYEGTGIHGITEAILLKSFWEQFNYYHSVGGQMIGHNIHGFDLPFLRRRSLLLGVPVPPDAIKDNRWWSHVFIDTMKLWQCGDNKEFISLNDLAILIGIKGKPDDVEGKDFCRLWEGTEEEREAAVDYLHSDLRMTWAIADQFLKSTTGGTT